MAERVRLVAGNWKMNGRKADLREAEEIARVAGRLGAVEVMLCPPATLLAEMRARTDGSRLLIGGQDCHAEMFGAHTGNISAPMLADAGASAVIVGHSERRMNHGETDVMVAAKAAAARQAGLMPIICVGESQADREAGHALELVARQVENSLPSDLGPTVVVAYEPIWAIGSGMTATPDDVGEMHTAIRARVVEILGQGPGNAVRILYGGSVRGSNAGDLIAAPEVDGFLVGGASLKAQDFAPIIEACAPAS